MGRLLWAERQRDGKQLKSQKMGTFGKYQSKARIDNLPRLHFSFASNFQLMELSAQSLPWQPFFTNWLSSNRISKEHFSHEERNKSIHPQLQGRKKRRPRRTRKSCMPTFSPEKELFSLSLPSPHIKYFQNWLFFLGQCPAIACPRVPSRVPQCSTLRPTLRTREHMQEDGARIRARNVPRRPWMLSFNLCRYFFSLPCPSDRSGDKSGEGWNVIGTLSRIKI